MGILLYYSYSKIKLNRQSHIVKLGTLYSEFKNNKGLLSVFFYVFYLSRRLQLILTQIYLNQNELLQSLLNICTGYAMIGFLIYYRPFKDNLIQLSNLICEICYSFIFTSLMIYSFGDDLISDKTYQYMTIFCIFGCVGIQFCISLYDFILSLKELYLKFLKRKTNPIVNRSNPRAIKITSILPKD